MVRLLSVAALVFIGVANVAAAQSLGDVAKKEEQRRKTVKSSGKVYTNDELKRDPTPSVPASASTGTTSTPSASSTPAPAPASSGNNAGKDDSANKDGSADKSDEKTWRKRITNARESLQRSQAFADALQSQLNALSTDFVNRDDPIQRQQIANTARRRGGRARSREEGSRRADQSHQRYPGRGSARKCSGRLGALKNIGDC